MTDKRPTPTDNLVRAWASPDAITLRAATTGDGNTMFGHFAVFDRFTEISSWFEGNFLERIAPGAFKDTFKARGDQIRVLYDHGADPQIGNKPLGVPDVLREDATGAYYEVGLFDSSYVNDLKPAIRSGQLGASFRLKVTGEEWVTPREATRENPQKLDERTITSVDLYEFGPVTFPAYPDASAGMRSRTDEFLEHFLSDPLFVARFKERAGPVVVDRLSASIPVSTTSFGTSATTYTSAAPTVITQHFKLDPDADKVTIGRAIEEARQAYLKDRTETADGGSEEKDAPTERTEDSITDETADGGEAESIERRKAWHKQSTADFDAYLATTQGVLNVH